VEKITKNRLYRISLLLYGEKAKLENYLSLQTNELFDIEDKIILYDLTNTYYEGRMVESRIAKYGRSKGKRNDAKLIVLALVVNPESFIKYSSILEGNVGDSSTLSGMIDELRLKTSGGGHNAIVVMVVTDRLKRKISLQKVTCDRDEDYYLKVESETKKRKESSMNDRFREGFETGLQKIAVSLARKGGVKQEDKVYERIGRLKQKYPSIYRHFEIQCEVAVETGKKKYKKDESSMAHLHLGLLAYRVVNTVRYQLKKTEPDKDSIRLQWKEIVRIMNTKKAVTSLAQNKSDEIIEIRRCTYPSEKNQLICDKLGYRYAPYKKKKSVVHKTIFEKNYPTQYRELNSS
jgi:hypothetical protein